MLQTGCSCSLLKAYASWLAVTRIRAGICEVGIHLVGNRQQSEDLWLSLSGSADFGVRDNPGCSVLVACKGGKRMWFWRPAWFVHCITRWDITSVVRGLAM